MNMNTRAKKMRKEGTETPFPAVQDDTQQNDSTIPQHTVDEVPPIVQEVISSSGQPLDTGTQTFMESRFGHDFRQVRLHTDERAVESAHEVNALAYTAGRDVVFGEKQYAPQTSKGQELIAHELTHVVQQAQMPMLAIQRAEPKNTSPTAAPLAGQSTTAADADIEALHLAKTAKEAAKKLKEKHPDIVFRSGRRTVADQALVMAKNIVGTNNRKWIEQVPYTGGAELQKWVDDNPKATTVDDIAKGLEAVMKGMTESKRAGVSKHLSGEAFDVQPQDKDADAIKKDMQALPGITKFLEKEGKLVRWHAEF